MAMAWTLASPSLRVRPYATAPASAPTSAIHRPSASLSNSTVSVTPTV
jgi:hypothetical protein